MDEKPFTTLRILGTKPSCTVVIEPLGNEYTLSSGDAFLIHVYGSTVGPDDLDTDVEIERAEGRLTLWLASAEYRIWNKAGVELRPI